MRLCSGDVRRRYQDFPAVAASGPAFGAPAPVSAPGLAFGAAASGPAFGAPAFGAPASGAAPVAPKPAFAFKALEFTTPFCNGKIRKRIKSIHKAVLEDLT
jgi:3-oxoacyl-ACP reductase-like protein